MTVWHETTTDTEGWLGAPEETQTEQPIQQRLTWRMIGAICCAVLATTAAYFLN